MSTHTAGGTSSRSRSTAHAVVIGLDVGSTTVKAVVVDPESRAILWSDYEL